MPMDKIIYLDNAATSKVDQEVLDSFNQITLKYYANPSSIHHLGQEANRLLEKSREQILKLLELNHHEVAQQKLIILQLKATPMLIVEEVTI